MPLDTANTQTALQQLKTSLPLKGRMMAIDYGEKKVGLAISDETRLISTPLACLKSNGFTKLIASIFEQVQTFHIRAVVVGLPLHMNGEMSSLAQTALTFSRHLQKALPTLPIVLYDERWTSLAVERSLIAADMSRKRRGEVVDKLAACYLLQGVLDGLRHQPREAL